jgi:4-amino-4-deoxy-L-arabinose transferase-like glycosyltransferase
MTAVLAPRAAIRADRRVLLILLLVGVFAGAAALRVWAVANTDPFAISASKPLVDDSFYYFSLGRNLADSLAARVDSFHLTNGFQPLWGFLAAIPYVFLSDAAAIPALQLMGAAFSLGAGAVIYAFTVEVTRSRLAGTLNAAAWLFMPYTVNEAINGMETSLAVFGLLLAAWLFYRWYAQPTRQRLIAAGLAGGLAVMARVDLVIFAAVAVAFLFLLPPGEQRTPTDRLRLALTYGMAALIPCIPWVIFSLAIGKFPLPESGAAVRALGMFSLSAEVGQAADLSSYSFRFNLERLIVALRNFIVWIAPIRRGIFADFYIWALALVGIAAFALYRRLSMWRILVTAGVTLGLFAAAYVLFVPAWWYYERYLHPLVGLFSALIGMIFVEAARVVGRAPRMWRTVGAALALVYVGALLYYGVYLNYRSSSTALFAAEQSHLEYEITQWANEHVRGDDVLIGSYQSGLVGYYLDFPHVNLDGVVNADAQRALVERNAWGYVCRRGITHIIERPDQIAVFLSSDQFAAPLTDMDYVAHLSQFGVVEQRMQVDGSFFNTDYVVLRIEPDKCPSGSRP